jgi:hypothetical protein
MTTGHAEQYESYEVGDEVWCLGWLGMPFVVVGKDDESHTIQIDGTGPTSLPEGARVDLHPENHYMLTHERWDAIWYWPDVEGEQYKEVAERFVDQHEDGEIVTGYAGGVLSVVENPRAVMSFRITVSSYWTSGQIHAQPVAAIADGADADAGLVLSYDPALPDERWLPTGPRLPLEIKMVAFRWALAYGKIVLNWPDFH